jgi:hypothetical protein
LHFFAFLRAEPASTVNGFIQVRELNGRRTAREESRFKSHGPFSKWS